MESATCLQVAHLCTFWKVLQAYDNDDDDDDVRQISSFLLTGLQILLLKLLHHLHPLLCVQITYGFSHL